MGKTAVVGGELAPESQQTDGSTMVGMRIARLVGAFQLGFLGPDMEFTGVDTKLVASGVLVEAFLPRGDYAHVPLQ